MSLLLVYKNYTGQIVMVEKTKALSPEEIKQFLKKHNMWQKTLADYMNEELISAGRDTMTQSLISRWINGTRRIENVYKINAFYNVKQRYDE